MLRTNYPTNKSIRQERDLSESCKSRTSSSGLPHVPITFVKPVLAGWGHLVVDESCGGGSIYLGPQQVAGIESAKYLRDANITGIVNCTNDFPNAHKNSMEYCRVALNDMEEANILPYLQGATEFLHRHVVERKGSVLVHCQMGISRSSTVVIAYLMRYHDLSRDQAYRQVKRLRPCIRPNQGFWHQLEVYEALLRSGPQQCLPMSTFDRGWAEQSLARFQTIGHLSKDRRKSFPEIKPDTNAEQILMVATDVLFERGVKEVDLPWFGALCFVLSQVNCDLETFLLEDGAAEGWYGERSPKHVDKITSTIRKSIST